MKGHIQQRSKGSWRIAIELPRDPATGKRRQTWQTIRGTKREAEQQMAELLKSVNDGVYVRPVKITVGDWLIKWLDEVSAIQTTRRTNDSYRSNINRHIIPEIGSIPLSLLEPGHLQTLYRRELSETRSRPGHVSRGLSARTVLYHHRILSRALGDAVRLGYCPRNAAKLAQPPRIARSALFTLKAGDVPNLLDSLYRTNFYVYYCTLLYCGLRRGEALALRWKNVDLTAKTLEVVETAYKLDDGTFVVKEPKTPHSRRLVSIPPSLALQLLEYRTATGQIKGIKGEDFVFAQLDGRPYNPTTVSNTFHKAATRAGVKMRLHDLRHTHATLMLAAGVHPKIVSERLGHATVGITLDTYSHVLPGLQEQAAIKFDNVLDAAKVKGECCQNVAKE
ncbi:MAG: tyrosine-type recombinase/integrase [Dehalogenimonas sp.]